MIPMQFMIAANLASEIDAYLRSRGFEFVATIEKNKQFHRSRWQDGRTLFQISFETTDQVFRFGRFFQASFGNIIL